MRRHFPTLLIGLGTFLVTVTLVLRVYGTGQLAVAEDDPQEVTISTANDATVFVPSQQAEVVADVTVKSRIVGDLEAAKTAPDGVVVWFTTTSRSTADGTVFQRSMSRTAMNKRSAVAEPCCDSFAEVVDEEMAADKRKSLVLKFPFGTEKRSYEIWDGTLGATVTAAYRGEGDVDGVSVYRFEIEVPDTVIGTETIAANLVGVQQEGSIEAERSYGGTRTLFVEPRTGAILNDVQDVRDTLSYDGTIVRTLFDGKLSYTDDQIGAYAEKYGDRARSLRWWLQIVPLSALFVGILCLAAGLWRRRTSGRHV